MTASPSHAAATGHAADELRTIADALCSRIQGGTSADEFAYALLIRDGVRHPWTEAAEQVWANADRMADGAAGSEWRDHHLAILHHARAYDLEAVRSDEAFKHWRLALRYWARLHHRDQFWELLRSHLTECMGATVGPQMVAEVRSRLPYDVLAPHLALAAGYRETQPERGRGHMTLVVESTFSSAVIAELREDLVREVLAEVPSAVELGRHAHMMDQLESWLAVDRTNPYIVRALLLVHRRWLESQWAGIDALVGELGTSVDRVERLVRPVLAQRQALPQLMAEISRHEYWLGALALNRTRIAFERQRFVDAEQYATTAVEQFEQARRLDNTIGMDQWYGDIDIFDSQAVLARGACAAQRGRAEEAKRHVRRAAELNPNDPQPPLLLAQILVGTAAPSSTALDEAATALATATRLAADGPEVLRDAIRRTTQLLELRRRRRGLAGPN